MPVRTWVPKRSPGEKILDLVRPHGEQLVPASQPQALSADEFALTQLESRGDAAHDADRHNIETFQCEAKPGGGAWAVSDMLEAGASSAQHNPGFGTGKVAALAKEESGSWPDIATGTCAFMDLSIPSYAARFRSVELNFTFHDGMAGKDMGIKQYNRKAKEFGMLGLQAVVKVSGLATHESRLQDPDWWWPWLWARYSALSAAGVLAALLWQFPPSCECSDEMLERLTGLRWAIECSGCHAPSVLEFRHPSWYERPDVEALCRQHGFSMAWVHFKNDTGWAGHMPNGWSPRFPVQTGPVLYLRLFGSEGRNVGEYDEAFLREQIIGRLPAANNSQRLHGFVFFGQSDVPTQAQSNASRVASLLSGLAPDDAEVRQLQRPNPGLWLSGAPAIGDRIQGRVVRVSRSQAVLELEGGHQGILGTFHISTRGLRLRPNVMLSGLRVEGFDDQGRIRVTGREAEHESQESEAKRSPERVWKPQKARSR